MQFNLTVSEMQLRVCDGAGRQIGTGTVKFDLAPVTVEAGVPLAAVPRSVPGLAQSEARLKAAVASWWDRRRQAANAKLTSGAELFRWYREWQAGRTVGSIAREAGVTTTPMSRALGRVKTFLCSVSDGGLPPVEKPGSVFASRWVRCAARLRNETMRNPDTVLDTLEAHMRGENYQQLAQRLKLSTGSVQRVLARARSVIQSLPVQEIPRWYTVPSK